MRNFHRFRILANISLLKQPTNTYISSYSVLLKRKKYTVPQRMGINQKSFNPRTNSLISFEVSASYMFHITEDEHIVIKP
jgi:hypothetical protein